MADLTRPWPGPTGAHGIYLIERRPRWCIYGKHSFDTTSRNATCCDATECREIRKEVQRESNRRCREERMKRGCAN